MALANHDRIGGLRGTARAGFSLVELMVAVGIMLLLAGLIFSSLGRARVQGEISKSQSHLRQIGVALLAYANDNDARFPPARAVAPLETQIENPENAAWMSLILPYLGGDTRVLSSSFVARHNPAARDYSYFLGSHAAGHAQAQEEGSFNPLTCPPLNLLRIREPSKHILGGEALFGFSLKDADKDDYNRNNPAFGHSDPHLRVHLLFADGHIERVAAFDPTRMAVTYEGITNPPYDGYQ